MLNFKQYLKESFTAPNLPSITRRGRITLLEINRNPIHIVLDEGTELFLTWDQFKKIKPPPQLNDSLEVKFQRLLNDFSNNSSKIVEIKVIN
jgi:hypothetical protein